MLPQKKTNQDKHLVAGALQRHNPRVAQRHNPRVAQRHNPRVVQRHNPRVVQRHNPRVVQRHNPRVVQRHNPRVVFSQLPGQSQLQLEPLDVIKALTRTPLYLFTLKWHSLVGVWRLVHKRTKCIGSIPKKFQDFLPLRISQTDIHICTVQQYATQYYTTQYNTLQYSKPVQCNSLAMRLNINDTRNAKSLLAMDEIWHSRNSYPSQGSIPVCTIPSPPRQMDGW